MDQKTAWYDKPLYSNSNIKYQDIAWLLAFMFVLVPLVLVQANKTVNILTLLLITLLLIVLMLVGDLIFRTKVLDDIKDLDRVDYNIFPVPLVIKVVLAAGLLISAFYLIMSVGLLLSIYAIYLLYPISKLVLAFFPRLLCFILARFQPQIYEAYREKSIEFKYRYSIGLAASLALMGIIIVPIIRSNPSEILAVRPLWSGDVRVYLMVGLTVLLAGISGLLTKKFQLNSLKKNDSFTEYRTDYNKVAGGILFFTIVLIAIIWFTWGASCFT